MVLEHSEHTIEDVVVSVVEDSSSKPFNDIELISKRNTKAFIWKYFRFEPNEKGNPQSKDQPKCCPCQLEIAAKDGNISNLYSHLKNKHPKEYDIVQRVVGNSSKKQQTKPEQLLLVAT